MKTKLIFVSYLSRSGSTFIVNSFSRYNNILVCPESEVLLYNLLLSKKSKGIKMQFKKLIFSDDKLKSWRFCLNDIETIFEGRNNPEIFYNFLETYKNNIKPKANIIIFKEQNVFLFKKVILSLLENHYAEVKFFYILRDPRAIFNSQHTTIDPYSNKKMATNPVYIAKQWNKHIKFFKNIDYLIKYEDFVENHYEEYTKIEEYLKLDIRNKTRTGDLYARLSPKQQSIHKNLTLVAIKEKTDSWKINTQNLYYYKIIEYVSKKNINNFLYKLYFCNYKMPIFTYVLFEANCFFMRMINKVKYLSVKYFSS